LKEIYDKALYKESDLREDNNNFVIEEVSNEEKKGFYISLLLFPKKYNDNFYEPR